MKLTQEQIEANLEAGNCPCGGTPATDEINALCADCQATKWEYEAEAYEDAEAFKEERERAL